MNEIEDTVEVAAFADIIWANQSDRRQRLILGAKLYQDVGVKAMVSGPISAPATGSQ